MKFFIMAAFSFNFFAYGEIFIPVCGRTSQVRDAIVKKLKENVDSRIDCNLADYLLDQIKTLYLRGRSIESLKVGDFSALTSLETLDLDNNNLRELLVGVFSGLTSLIKLDLERNKLSTLPSGIFSDLHSLRMLRLFGNNLKIPYGVFSGLDSLQILYIQTDIPEKKLRMNLPDPDNVRIIRTEPDKKPYKKPYR